MYDSIIQKLKIQDTIFVIAPFVLKTDRYNFFSYLKRFYKKEEITIIGV
jgi:hypothetical protein